MLMLHLNSFPFPSLFNTKLLLFFLHLLIFTVTSFRLSVARVLSSTSSPSVATGEPEVNSEYSREDVLRILLQQQQRGEPTGERSTGLLVGVGFASAEESQRLPRCVSQFFL